MPAVCTGSRERSLQERNKGLYMTANDMAFSYFIGEESEQFSFVKVPKLFFTDERFSDLSYGAKILYGLLLDRMNLSKKNKWMDSDKKVYVIYTIESIQEDFSVSKSVAVKFMRELEEFGLIEKKRRPNAAAFIYVKNFILPDQERTEEKSEIQGSLKYELPEVQNVEVQKMNFQKEEEIQGSPYFGLPENRLPEVQNMDSNKTNINKTDINISSSNYNTYKARDDDIREQIIRRINYYEFIRNNKADEPLGEKILECLIVLFGSTAGKYKIDNAIISAEEVRKKIWEQLSENVFREVLENISNNGAETIYNLQNYVITCFYKIIKIKKSRFSDFQQNEYDFTALEKELLST